MSAHTARARASQLSTLSRSLGAQPPPPPSFAGEATDAEAVADLAARLGDNERGLHMVMDLVEQSMPRSDADAQLELLHERVARLEQLLPGSSLKVPKEQELKSSLARLEQQLLQQAAQIEGLTVRQPLARPVAPSYGGLTEADVAAMIESKLGAAIAAAVAGKEERSTTATQQPLGAGYGGELEDLRLGAAAMNRRLLACEGLAADATARSERGVTDALTGMAESITDNAVAESARVLREEIGGLRARCSAAEDEGESGRRAAEAGRRASEAALEHGLTQLGDALRQEVSSATVGLCRVEDLRQTAAELSASVSAARDTAAQASAQLRRPKAIRRVTPRSLLRDCL